MRSIAILILLLSFFACKDDNTGEAKVAPVSNVTYTAANGSILFQWDNPQMTNLAYVEISYVDKSGVVHRCLTKGGLTQQVIEGIADNSPYYFRFLVYNTKGEVSDPVEVMASALESTVNLFYGRVSLKVDFGGVNVVWENSYNENFYVELTYTDLNGNFYKEEVVAGAFTSGKQFVKIGSSMSGSQSIKIYASIVDENGNESEQKVLDFFKKEAGKLDRSKWRVVSYSSQNDDSPVTNVLDDDPGTIWHSKWQGSKPDYPHWFILDLGSKKKLEKVGIQQRKASQLLRGVEIYGNNVSASPSDEKMWTLFHAFDVAVGQAEQVFEFPDIVTYRYIKMMFVTPCGTDGGDNKCAGFATLNFYGSDVVDE